MKNHTSIICSLVGGMLIGSAATCIVHNRKKLAKIDAGDIHKKIISQIEQLRNFVASQHSEAICSCEDPACNCKKE